MALSICAKFYLDGVCSSRKNNSKTIGSPVYLSVIIDVPFLHLEIVNPRKDKLGLSAFRSMQGKLRYPVVSKNSIEKILSIFTVKIMIR